MKLEPETRARYQQICKIIDEEGHLRPGLKSENTRDLFQIAVMRLVLGWQLDEEPYRSEMEKDLQKIERAVQIAEEKEKVARAWKTERPGEN